MKKDTTFYVIFAVCAICILGLVWKCWSQSRVISAYGQVLSSERDFIEINDKIRNYQYQEILALRSVGCDISATSIKHDNDPSMVYLRLHEGICGACYVGSIIDSYKTILKSNSILIVGSYQYQSALDDLLRDCEFTDVDYINSIPALNRVPADSANAPYIFTINDRGIIDNILFLDKSVMSPTKINAYIEMIDKLK